MEKGFGGSPSPSPLPFREGIGRGTREGIGREEIGTEKVREGIGGMEIRLPEGKYRGQTLEQAPVSYLARVAQGRVRVAPNLAALMEDELAERGQRGR